MLGKPRDNQTTSQLNQLCAWKMPAEAHTMPPWLCPLTLGMQFSPQRGSWCDAFWIPEYNTKLQNPFPHSCL